MNTQEEVGMIAFWCRPVYRQYSVPVGFAHVSAEGIQQRMHRVKSNGCEPGHDILNSRPFFGQRALPDAFCSGSHCLKSVFFWTFAGWRSFLIFTRMQRFAGKAARNTVTGLKGAGSIKWMGRIRKNVQGRVGSEMALNAKTPRNLSSNLAEATDIRGSKSRRRPETDYNACNS